MATEKKLKRWLSKTKITPPRRRVQSIARLSLIEQLNLVPDGGVISVCAPAGYGKSSLMAEWRQSLIQRGEKCAWVGLDEGDDAEIILAHIAYAFHLIGINCDETGLLEPGELNDSNLQRELRTLLNVIERQSGKVFLVFDDCERYEKDVLKDVLLPLVRWAPNNLIIAFSGRVEMSLDFTELLLRGMLVLLDVNDLKFDDAEIREVWGDEKSPNEVSMIMAASAGWPALIQLARSGNISISRVANKFSINSGADLFSRYLYRAVLSPLPPQSLEFLLQASVFTDIPVDFFKRRFSARLLQDFVNGTHSLSEFIAPLDDELTILRMHPLLRECLKEQFNKEHSDQAHKLHTDAAMWFADSGREISAIRHASQTPNLSLIEEILFRSGGPFWLLYQGLRHLRRVNQLIQRSTNNSLLDTDKHCYPLVLLTDIIDKAKAGQTEIAQNLLFKLEAAKTNMDLNNDAHQHMVEFSAALAITFLDCHSHTPFSDSNADTLSHYKNSELASSPFIQGSIFNVEIVYAIEHANFHQAVRSGESSLKEFRKAPSPFGEAHVSLLLSSTYLEKADVERTTSAANTAECNISNALSADKELEFGLAAIQNAIRFETSLNGVIKIKDYAQHVVDNLVSVNVWFDFIAIACSQITDSFVINGNYEKAEIFIRDCRLIANKRGQQRFNNYLDGLSTLVSIRKGATSPALPVSKTPRTWREDVLLAEVIFLYPGKNDRTRIEYAEHVLNEAIAAKNIRANIRLSFAKAHWLMSRDRVEDGLLILSSAASLAIKYSFLAMATLSFDLIKSTLVLGEETAEIDEELKPIIEIYHRISAQIGIVATDGPLTVMELRVGKALIGGGADKEIGRALGISHNTVRYHLKNIYRKLGVSNRTQASHELVKVIF